MNISEVPLKYILKSQYLLSAALNVTIDKLVSIERKVTE
jgi:hypothetical protein